MSSQQILVVAEMLDGSVRKTTWSAVTFARQVAGSTGAWDLLVLGEGASAAAAQVNRLGARKVLAGDIAGGYVAERYAPTVAQVAQQGGYRVVVSTASTYGKDLMPRVAARVGAGVASDIVSVQVDGDSLVYRRPMYAGNVLADVQVTTPLQVVTVRQSEFAATTPVDTESPVEPVAVVASTLDESRVRFVGLQSQKSARPELTEAAIVVSGGRGLKSAENFHTVLEPLVDALGAAMGASRAACDAGYVPNDLQVGQTGKVVAPKLYVAVGLSGAIQHLAGMKNSKVIVAINKDKEAPIAQVADYVWVTDLFQAVPAITEEVKKLKASG
jgi:electron transfer flavoprotein alpha subunit